MNKNNALVAVSSGLLQAMDKVEEEAVLAHEVPQVANGDMVTLALVQGVVNTFVIFLSRVIGHTVDRVVFKTERGHGPAFFVTSIVARLVLGILASISVMWFSRQREFRADAGEARLAGRGIVDAFAAYRYTVPLTFAVIVFSVLWSGFAGNHRRLEAMISARLAFLAEQREIPQANPLSSEGDSATSKVLVPVEGSRNSHHLLAAD